MTKASDLRDKALAKVQANANKVWFEIALDSVRQLAAERKYFTSDDVWHDLATYWSEIATHNNSAMGAVIKVAAQKSIISPTNRFVNSTRPSSHARLIRVWKSNY